MELFKRYYLKTGVVAVIVLFALSGVAMRNDINRIFKFEKAEQPVAGLVSSVKGKLSKKEEAKLYSEYETVLKTIDPGREEYFQKGKLTVINEEDSSVLTPETIYLVSRKGKDCYYQLGQSETYNIGGLYVYVDHRIRKILLSAQKELTSEALVAGKTPGKALKEEGYQISVSGNGSNREITLLNPDHPLYKEYTLSYDAASGKVSGIFTRMANERDPFAKGQGKLVFVKISESSAQADMNAYDPLKVVKLKGKEWGLTERFKGYELVVM